jgi:hypothetical protein
MPAKSEKQKQFMDAAAHNPAFAKASGVPVKVAKEFSEKSKGMKFGKDTNTSRPDLQKVNKPKTLHGKMSIMKEGGDTMATKMKKGYADGGMTMVNKGGKMVPDFAADGKGKMAKGGMTKKMNMGGMAASAMGKVKTAAPSRDGVATKGKTKGAMVKMSSSKPLGMKRGGKAC